MKFSTQLNIFVLQNTVLFTVCASKIVSKVTETSDNGAIDSSIQKLTPLYIGGIFPMSADQGGWPGGQACRPAAMMALEHVNKRKDILPGYVLKMIDKDSQCQPGLGAKVMYELLYQQPTKLMLLAGCSLVTTTVAEAASLWNVVVLSYGASSPALSDRERFPTLFRTHPSATIHNPTRVALFKKFHWTKVAILQSVEELFTSTAEDLERLCRENNVTIISRQSFFGDPSDAVKNLERQDARVIIGLFYEKEARKVFCEVYKANLYGKKYVWFLIGWYSDSWFVPSADDGINCTQSQMQEAAQYHFTTEAIMWNRDGGASRSESGMTAEQFEANLTNRLESFPNQTGGWVESPLAYDAIWALALALNCSMNSLARKGIRLEQFSYARTDMYEEIYSCMNKTRFLGISGMVMFSAKGDRIAWTLIEQLQDGHYKELGKYDFRSGNLTFDHSKAKFLTKGNKPPPDSTIIVESPEMINIGLFWGLAFLAVVAVLLAIACIAFNFIFRDRRLIQQSQPILNSIILAGFIVCCLGIFLLGIDRRFVSTQADFGLLCHARVWVLCLGFSLSYGSMFSKVWRVHRMSSSETPDQVVAYPENAVVPKSEDSPSAPLRKITAQTSLARFSLGSCKSGLIEEVVEPWKLYAPVAVFVALDLILLTCWTAINPLYRSIEHFESIISTDGNEDIMREPILDHCECENANIWIGIFYAYKGLLLLFGVFLAYEVRNVKLKHLNDSRFVGMAIYNVVVLCLITGPVSLIISSQPNASFAFIALTIFLCTFISMALIFVPKIFYIRNVPRSIETRANTERIVSKEDDERFKRLSAENEDIKRQIAEKEARIRELNVRLQERIAAKAYTSARASASAALLASSSRQSSLRHRGGCSSSSQNNVQQLCDAAGAVVPETNVQQQPCSSCSEDIALCEIVATTAGSCSAAMNTAPCNSNEMITTTSIQRVSIHREPEDSGYRSSCKSVSLVEPLETDVLL